MAEIIMRDQYINALSGSDGGALSRRMFSRDVSMAACPAANACASLHGYPALRRWRNERPGVALAGAGGRRHLCERKKSNAPAGVCTRGAEA